MLPSRTRATKNAAELESDLDPEEQPRKHTSGTDVDWSGCSYEENGRQYQGYMPGGSSYSVVFDIDTTDNDTVYDLTTDGEEQDHIDLQHAIIGMILNGKLTAAPVQSPSYVLDIGTGTGIWCLKFAEANPNSFVIGTDLCLIQPHPKTSNCAFILENSETADWMFPATLDYVHMRSVGPYFDNVRTVIRKSYDSMTPGGWIDLQDGYWEPLCIDDSLDGTALQRWFQLVVLGGWRQGRDMLKAKDYKQYLIQAGFTNVEEKIYQIPGNPWVTDCELKKIGRWVEAACLQMVESYHKFMEFAGLTQTEIEEFIPAVKRDILDCRIHWYCNIYFVYGQKPMPHTFIEPFP